ncbi:MAG: hypothetical protein WCX65_17330 [bacterium]
MNASKDKLQKPRVIGSATFIALAVIAVYIFYNSKQFTQPKTAPPHVRADFKIPNEPDTADIIVARDKLSLNETQIASLGGILADWQKQSAQPIADMRKEYENMGKFLNAAPKKPPRLQELLQNAGPLSDATSKYLKIRDSFQTRAMSVLTSAQIALWGKVKKGNEALRNEKQNSQLIK